jgi:REP element-mobilizing transposase RayT
MRRNKLAVYLHFVWATWDRFPWITEEIEEDLYRYIVSVCQDDECEVLAIGGMPDHVHLLVRFSNTLSFAEFMKHVKGGSSRFFTEKTGKTFQWQANYGVFSVSARDKPKVIDYIRNQKQHHAEQTLWDEAEKTHVLLETVQEPHP